MRWSFANPRAEKRHLIQAGIALIALIVISFAIALAIRRLAQRITAVSADVDEHQDSLATAQAAAPENTGEHQRKKTLSILQRALKPTQTLGALRAVRDLLIWSVLLLWCGGIAWAALLFPQTTPLGHSFVRNGLIIASIFIITASSIAR